VSIFIIGHQCRLSFDAVQTGAMHCKPTDFEEWRLLGCYAVWLL
jgi:hypothetical protein